MSDNIKFYRPTPYSPETKETIWHTIVTDSHDTFCGCTEPILHLINNLIPPDHRDRHQSIDYIIKRGFKAQHQLWLSGGGAATDGGEAGGGLPTKEEKETDGPADAAFADINIEDLLDAAKEEDPR